MMNPESMLKGRMAETLVEEMLKESGNRVYRFGYESIMQNLAEFNQNIDREGEVGRRIRAIPDFIVVDKKGIPSFVEVKFRWKPGIYHKEDYEMIERIKKFWEARIIFVNCWEKPYFRICEPPYLRGRQLIQKPLLDVKEWRIDKKLYEKHEELVKRYLTPTLIPSGEKKPRK